MIIKNVNIVLEEQIITNGFIRITNKKITNISKKNIVAENNEKIIDANNNFLLPGFIDCHIHGGYGVDFETGDKKRFKTFSEAVVKEGITSYVQASVTSSVKNTEKFLSEFANYVSKNNTNGAKCLGLHLEGPFISKEKKGAHDENLLIKPDILIVDKWNKISKNNIKIITYANDGEFLEFTKELLKRKIIPSIGHTNSKAEQFDLYYNEGVRHITHLFNGMSGIDHYRPGLALAGLLKKDVLVEVISDGIHLDKEILKLIFKIKGAENICIITDSINAKGLADGNYKIGDLEVIKEGVKVSLKSSGVLAGSGSTYNYNARIYKEVCEIDWVDLIKMTSINIAKQLGIFSETGSIEVGKLADLVIVDDNLNVVSTIVNGEEVFSK